MYPHFELSKFIMYLERTTEQSWCTGVVRTKDQKANCLFGHLFEYGGGNNRTANAVWDLFENTIATTFMVYRVNDGDHPEYQQETPKQRCVAYLRDINCGKQQSVRDMMAAEFERRSEERAI